jgi:large subunit ribosomal protein L7/L12
MNIVKKTLASLLVMMALVSTSAFANSAGDAKVLAAGEATIAKMEEAVSLSEKGADKAEILAALSEVRQLQKEFRYEQTERLRQKAGDKLKTARSEVEDGNANAAASLKAALGFYKEMMVVYSAAH